MKKLAISYFYSIYDGVCGIKINSSGKEALEEIESKSKQIFRMPLRRNRKHMTIPSKGQVTIGNGISGCLLARFLTDDEVKIYKKFGDKTCYTGKWDFVKLCAPDEVEK